MARRGGWRREGRKGRFRYADSRGKRITDPEKIERIEELAIPPAWREVWISPRPRMKLQATGIDRAGRTQYLYHPEFRTRKEQEKFAKLVRFAERLPDLREAMGEHMERDPLDPEWTCALAVRLINLGWFRVGTERYAQTTKTFGITTLRKSHVTVRGSRIVFRYRAKHRVWVRTAVIDAELAAAMKELLDVRGGRGLFRYRNGDGTSLSTLTGARLNEYIREHLGDEFTAKDFRTWGGTLLAAIAFAEHDPPKTETDAKLVVAGVMRAVGESLGNTAAVARSSAVVEQYLEGRTLDDFRPRHLRVVGARDTGLDREERALLALLRSWRNRRAQVAA